MNLLPYAFIEKIKLLPFVEVLYVFGSRARGDNFSHSDIDLAIGLNDDNYKNINLLENIIEEADTLLTIDWVDIHKADKEFMAVIMKDAVKLYDRKESMKQKITIHIEELRNALDSLEKAIHAPVDSDRFVIDSAIQRFEYSFELSWKVIKEIQEHVFDEPLPFVKKVLEKAYESKWIDNEALWISMLKDRNMMSHTYKKIDADAVYVRIKEYYPEMRKLYNTLQAVIATASTTP